MIGSISNGTLRTPDLLRAFADTLERLGGPVAESGYDLISDARKWADRMEADPKDLDDKHVGEQILSDLSNALGVRAPDYCYFGAHEGDGSDFGFWPAFGLINELPRVSDADEARALGEDCVSVNDHGNLTVYGGDGSVILELV